MNYSKINDERKYFKDFKRGFYDLDNPALWKTMKEAQSIRDQVRRKIGGHMEAYEGNITIIGDPIDKAKETPAPLVGSPAPLVGSPAGSQTSSLAGSQTSSLASSLASTPVGSPRQQTDPYDEKMKDFEEEIRIIKENMANEKDNYKIDELVIDLNMKFIEQIEYEIKYKTDNNIGVDVDKLKRKMKKLRDAITNIQLANPKTKLEQRLIDSYSAKPSPSYLTMKRRGTQFVLDDWNIVVETAPTGEEDLVFSKGTQIYRRPNPSTGYLKLLTINDVQTLQNDKSILKVDVDLFKFDLSQMGLLGNEKSWGKDQKKRLKQEKYIFINKFEGSGLRTNQVIKYYRDPSELIDRLVVVMASIQAGNSSLASKNEASTILDQLRFTRYISTEEYNKLMSQI